MEELIEEYPLVVYPCSIWVAVNCSDAFLSQLFNEPFPPMGDIAGQALLKAGGAIVRFRNKECMTDRIMLHESNHATFILFEYLGCNVDYNNQEPFCFLADCIYDFCDQFRTKINQK